MQARFPFRFDPAYRRLARLFGVTPERAGVDLGDEELEARYGRWRVRKPRSNIAGVEVTGPYLFPKTAGPARLATTDRGLTFASIGDRAPAYSSSEFQRRHPLRRPRIPAERVAALDRERLPRGSASNRDRSRRHAARFNCRRLS
jgi:hypothetical protein